MLSNSVVTETASSVKKENLETADVNFQTPSSVKQSLESTDVSFQTPSSAKKESLELTNVNFQPPNISNVPEKIPTIQCIDEKPQLPTPVEPKTSETIIETDADDSPLDESVVVVIQAAVRGILVCFLEYVSLNLLVNIIFNLSFLKKFLFFFRLKENS